MKIADIDPDRLKQLNAGLAETTQLTEGLAVDFAVLLRAVVPDLPATEVDVVEAARGDGVTRRMALVGTILAHQTTDDVMQALQRHVSDTVRGWMCFALAARNGDDGLGALLDRLRPLAADPHFGVREWAWLAARPMITDDLEGAIRALTPWTADGSDLVRRFASEATRPRGVWCAHIGALKNAPEIGLPILEPLKADPSCYVQDSVGNWLNDAAKTCPDWVEALCARWRKDSGTKETAYIVKRATRSIKPSRA